MANAATVMVSEVTSPRVKERGCEDGGTDIRCGRNKAGIIPGSLGALADGGYAKYTFVLLPQNCEVDFQGATGL